MSEVKSKVIGLRVSDPKIIDYYDKNKKFCSEEIFSLLESLSQEKDEDVASDSDQESSLKEVDFKRVSRSIADFNAEIDGLARSDDIEDRFNSMSDLSQKILDNTKQISSQMVTDNHIRSAIEASYFSTRNALLLVLTVLIYIAVRVSI